jgi:hypothetical protein
MSDESQSLRSSWWFSMPPWLRFAILFAFEIVLCVLLIWLGVAHAESLDHILRLLFANDSSEQGG